MQLNPRTTSKLLDVPNEVLSYAFKYLSFLNVDVELRTSKDGNLKLVNRRIYSIVCRMLFVTKQKFTITYNHLNDPDKIMRFCNAYKITELDFALDIFCDFQKSIDLLKLMIQSLDSERIHRIERMAFRNLSREQSAELFILLMEFRGIECLSFDSSKYLLDLDVSQFLEDDKLKALSLDKCKMITDDMLSAVTPNTTLTKLKLASCNVTERTGHQVARCFPNLSNLTLAWSPVQVGAHINLGFLITKEMPITHLKLSNNKFLNNDDLFYVARILTLQSLVLEMLPAVKELSSLMHMVALTSLSLISLKLSNSDIGSVIITLPKLTSLVIKQCFVDNDIIDYIRQCTSLKRLECAGKGLTSNSQLRALLPDLVLTINGKK